MSVDSMQTFRRSVAATFGLACAVVMAQGAVVKGTVTDPDGEPLIGATVQVQNSKVAVVTDLDGNFTIDAEPGQNLVVSYVGYNSSTMPVGNNTTFSFILEPSNTIDRKSVV